LRQGNGLRTIWKEFLHLLGAGKMTLFDIVLQTSASLHSGGEPDDFRGIIHAEGDDGVRHRVGKVHAWRINAEAAAANGERLFDVCDAHSAELHEVHTLLYAPDQYHYSDAITDRFDAAGWDTLVLDYVILHPRWRGLRLGLLAVRKSRAAAAWSYRTSRRYDTTPTPS
jgi:hypothetical protein